MGRVQVEQGQFSEALATFRLASEATPSSIARLQKQGMLAFYLGEQGEAAKALDRAALLGISSKMFDPQSLVLLAMVRFRERDSRGLQRCVDNLARALERDAGNPRLERFMGVLRVLQEMLNRRVAAVVAQVRDLALDLRSETFDVEAACNLLAVLAEISAAEIQLEEIDRHVDTIALRFAGSRGTTELLARAASPHPPFEQCVRNGHHRVTELAEQALSHALNGNARAAVETLIAHASSTANFKLIDTARLTLHRYREKIGDTHDLSESIDKLRNRFAAASLVPPLGQPNGRASGGLALRVGTRGAVPEMARSAA